MMCLAVPVQITKLLSNNRAIASLSGVEKEISLALIQETVLVGDYVIIHVGYALNKLNEEDAKKTLSYFEQMLNEG